MADTARVSYTWEFSAAHRLMNHPGKCRRLHGHNYKVTIDVEGEVDKETGMVVDFDVLKKAARYVDEGLDHMTLLQSSDPLSTLLETDYFSSLVHFMNPPTVEVICESVASTVRKALTRYSSTTNHSRLVKVTIQETETGVASIEL